MDHKKNALDFLESPQEGSASPNLQDATEVSEPDLLLPALLHPSVAQSRAQTPLFPTFVEEKQRDRCRSCSPPRQRKRREGRASAPDLMSAPDLLHSYSPRRASNAPFSSMHKEPAKAPDLEQREAAVSAGGTEWTETQDSERTPAHSEDGLGDLSNLSISAIPYSPPRFDSAQSKAEAMNVTLRTPSATDLSTRNPTPLPPTSEPDTTDCVPKGNPKELGRNFIEPAPPLHPSNTKMASVDISTPIEMPAITPTSPMASVGSIKEEDWEPLEANFEQNLRALALQLLDSSASSGKLVEMGVVALETEPGRGPDVQQPLERDGKDKIKKQRSTKKKSVLERENSSKRRQSQSRSKRDGQKTKGKKDSKLTVMKKKIERERFSSLRNANPEDSPIARSSRKSIGFDDPETTEAESSDASESSLGKKCPTSGARVAPAFRTSSNSSNDSWGTSKQQRNERTTHTKVPSSEQTSLKESSNFPRKSYGAFQLPGFKKFQDSFHLPENLQGKRVSDADIEAFIHDKVRKRASMTMDAESEFVKQNQYGWDVAMVFSREHTEGGLGQLVKRRTNLMSVPDLIERLHERGLQTASFMSVQNDEIIVKIRCPLPRLEEFAEKISYSMLLDKNSLRKSAESSHYNLSIRHRPNITPIDPYEFHYAPYTTDERLQGLFRCDRGFVHPFSQMHRIKLIIQIIERKSECDIDWVEMLHHGDMLAFFPLHDTMSIEHLRDSWIAPGFKNFFRPEKQPLWEIKEYLGEKEGLYFALLGHYTHWLGYLSIVGFAVCMNQVIQYTVESYSSPYFCIFASFWCIFMLDFWKRKEATLAMEWGMTGFQKMEHDRLHFKGVLIESHIDGELMTYFPPSQRRKRVIMSNMIMSSLVLVVFGAVISLYIFKFFLQSLDGTVYVWMAPYFANVVNAFRIQIMNYVYTVIAVSLTERENHRTDSGFEKSLIRKIMMFQGVNSYTTFFYIAFVKKYIEGCDYGDFCMTDLLISLAIIFGMQVLTNFVTEIIVPHYKAKWKRKQETKGTNGQELSQEELEYTLLPHDRMMLNIKDFSKLVIQYGYVTFFVTAFPGAPIMAWFANCVKIHVDAYKLLFEYQRAIPTGKENIGIWFGILSFFSKVAVITNIALVTFTMDEFILDHFDHNASLAHKVWFFFLLQYAIFGAQAILMHFIEDVPEAVNIQLARTEVIHRKIIKSNAMHSPRSC